MPSWSKQQIKNFTVWDPCSLHYPGDSTATALCSFREEHRQGVFLDLLCILFFDIYGGIVQYIICLSIRTIHKKLSSKSSSTIPLSTNHTSIKIFFWWLSWILIIGSDRGAAKTESNYHGLDNERAATPGNTRRQLRRGERLGCPKRQEEGAAMNPLTSDADCLVSQVIGFDAGLHGFVPSLFWDDQLSAGVSLPPFLCELDVMHRRSIDRVIGWQNGFLFRRNDQVNFLVFTFRTPVGSHS